MEIKKRNEILKLMDDNYHVLASSGYIDEQTRTLNYGDTFAIYDRWGDIKELNAAKMGLFYKDTRYICTFEMLINNKKPMLLSSDVLEENHIFVVDITNPDLNIDDKLLEKNSIYLKRTKFLQDGICYEKIFIKNFRLQEITFELSIHVEADFQDIFEVRGTIPKKRGKILPVEIQDGNTLLFQYDGLDQIRRSSEVSFFKVPDEIHKDCVKWQISLQPDQSIKLQSHIVCFEGNIEKQAGQYESAFEQLEEKIRKKRKNVADFYSNNELFNNWINKSKHDLLSLIAETDKGPYPFAGVPWYNTPFGRDGIITAMFTIWIAPHIAKGVLYYLAATQATESNDFSDSEPGKILHETRQGEMANTGQVPFGCYFGTVDATPLFVMLAGMYFRHTYDFSTLKDIWPHIKKAIKWIDDYGDPDGDGFIEYGRKSGSGLQNQGWKDSGDSIMHADGSLATGPIAVCEVQGYVYAAKMYAADMAIGLNENDHAEKLINEAEKLKDQFNKQFWDEKMGTFVLALDGKKNPCRVKASNAGQCLFTGIASDEHAAKTIKTLMKDDLFSGWGIRTLATGEVRYNPMSYHNGSVWPHDTALISAGMARYGFREDALKLLSGMFEAALFLQDHRLPELFCGFAYRQGQAPVQYPVACSPQAWAVSSVFQFVQAALQIEVRAAERIVVFDKPALPDFIHKITIDNIPIGNGCLDLEIFRNEYDTGFHIIQKPDGWEVVIKK